MNLPLEIIVHVFSFTDVITRYSCRETCSALAHLLKKRVFVIKSLQMKDFYSVLRVLKRSKADRLTVRFTKVPKAINTSNIRGIYEELSTIDSITELDVSELDSEFSCSSPNGFARLESVRFSSKSNSTITLPNLTKLCSADINTLNRQSGLLDLEFKPFLTSDRISLEHCTNLTRLFITNGREIDLQRLTALKDLHIHSNNSLHEFQVRIPTSNLESLQISGVNVTPHDVFRNLNLTRLSISMSDIKGPENLDLDLSSWRLLTRLRDLSIEEVTTATPLSFMNGLPNLEKLSIQGRLCLNDFSSEKILPLEGGRLTKLVTLNIPHLDVQHFTALCDINIRYGVGKISANNLTAIEATQIRDITFLGNLTNVRSLRIPTCLDFGDLPNLESLSISQDILNPKNIQTLSALTLLTRLIVVADNNADLPFLVSLTNLVQLHILPQPAKASRTHVKHVTNLQKLEELTLPRPISSEELDSISTNLTQLTAIAVLSNNGDGTALTRLTNLVEAYFAGPKMIEGLGKILESRLPHLVMFSRELYLRNLKSIQK